MKVLVVGGAGYIGSQVVHTLTKTEHDVRVLDDLSTGHLANINNEFLCLADITKPDAVLSVFNSYRPDAVIHLAAKKAVGESMTNPELYMHNNITGTINILNAMSAVGSKYFIFSSSAAVYGDKFENPYLINEEEQLNPINVYGYTKLAIENLLPWYEKTKGIKSVCLRYFNAAGYDTCRTFNGLDKNPQNVLPILMEVLSGKRSEFHIFGDDYDTPDGTCIRDYISIDDLANAHILSLDYLQNNPSTILNLGTSKGVSVKELVTKLEEITNRKIPVVIDKRRSGDPAVLVADYQKAKSTINWMPVNSDISSILISTLQAYKLI